MDKSFKVEIVVTLEFELYEGQTVAELEDRVSYQLCETVFYPYSCISVDVH